MQQAVTHSCEILTTIKAYVRNEFSIFICEPATSPVVELSVSLSVPKFDNASNGGFFGASSTVEDFILLNPMYGTPGLRNDAFAFICCAKRMGE
jgi:hypothetical protein